MISSFIITRVRIMRGKDVAFDEEFHQGVNIIRGENSSGKSTISDFIFYGLGGEFDRWKDAAAQCSAVRIEIEAAEARLTLHRSVGGKQEPILVYYGSLEDSLSKGIDHWLKAPIRRPPSGKELSITQILFRAAGIPEAPNFENSNITMHQILRLLYSDQQTPAGKLFRFENFDTRDIREAVGQLIIGVNGYKMYEAQIKLRELISEYAEKDRLYKAALLTLPRSEGLASIAALNIRINQTVAAKGKLLTEISNVDAYVNSETVNEFVAERRSMQERLRRLTAGLHNEESRFGDLQDERVEIQQFIEYLDKQLLVLRAAENLSNTIGHIEFQYCPSCLKPLELSTGHHCIVCQKVLDDDHARSRYFELKIDTEHQLRESKQLLTTKSAELENLKSKLRLLRREHATILAEFSARYDSANSPRESFLAERNKLVGSLEREIVFLEDLRVTIEKLDTLSRERASLNDDINIIQANIKEFESSSTSRIRKSMDSISVIGKRLLRSDLPREDTFEDPRTFSINFGDDAMLVDGKMNFAESSNVVLKNSSILAILLSACYDADFWHPRFLLMDNIEDKGMEQDRSHNYQRLIVKESSMAKYKHQIIFTTSMIDPSLEESELTVGPRYTRQHKTLT